MSATSASSSEVPECPVCHGGYKEPKILPCTHLVCKKCVVTWLSKAGMEGGCPLCSAPILTPTSQGHSDLDPSVTDLTPTSQGHPDLDTLVNHLPTDLATMSLVECFKTLSGHHVCMICDDNAAATSFCLQCDAKLCQSCVRAHKNIPATRRHAIEDLNKLSPQQLAEINRATCNVHDDRLAELYCSTHQELICMMCDSTNHRHCADVKAIPDFAREKRRELERQAHRLRDRETALATQIKEAEDVFPAMREKAKVTFDDLENSVKKGRQEVDDIIEAKEDASMTTVAELEKWRAALALNAACIEKLVTSASGGALLGMSNSLTSRLNHLEAQTGTPRKVEVTDLSLIFEKLDQLKADIATLATSTATSARTPKPADKPRRAELAKVLRVGDRVKPGPNWSSALGPHDRTGTVTATPSRLLAPQGMDPEGFVDVRWDSGDERNHCMGRDRLYELDLL